MNALVGRRARAAVRAVVTTLFFATCAACFPVPCAVPWWPRSFDADRMLGGWFVVATNFPMWLDGERCDPQLTYPEMSPVDGNFRMADEVSYVVPGEPERSKITGVDVQSQDNPIHFTWRGDGLLSLFTSEWYVAYVSADGAMAIIYFTETPATPPGVDVIVRDRNVSPETRAAAEQVIRTDTFLRRNAAGLVWLGSDDPRVPAACRGR